MELLLLLSIILNSAD